MLEFLNNPALLETIVKWYMIGLIIIGLVYGVKKEGKRFFSNFF